MSYVEGGRSESYSLVDFVVQGLSSNGAMALILGRENSVNLT